MAPKRKQTSEKSSSSTSNNKKQTKKVNHDEEEEPNQPLSWLEKLNEDEFYMLIQFLDASSFRTLPLLSRHVQRMFSSCLTRLLDYDEFEKVMRTKRVDPRISMYLMAGETMMNGAFVKSYRKGRQSLNIEIFFKALDRFPGGNSDQFILKWNLTFEANKKPSLKKGSLHNWDGMIGGNKMAPLKTIRSNLNDFLKSVMALSFEEPNKRGKYYCTVTDNRRDREEYDTKWSKVEVKVHSGDELVIDFVQQVIYPQCRNSSKYNAQDEVVPTPAMTNMLKELCTFCGVTTPEQESENKTISSKENPGRELKLGEGYTSLLAFLSKLEQ